MRRIVGSLVAGLALLVTLPAALLGQVERTRPSLDYFLSRYHAVAAADGRQEGVGGRLMWPTTPVLGRGFGTWLDRSAIGAYLVHTPEGKDGEEVWRYGVEADFSMGARPNAGRVEPIASLSVGALRWKEAGVPASVRPPFAPSSSVPAPETFFSVAPGLGVRLRFLPGIGIRGDARQVIDFRDGVRRNLELSGGLSVGV